MTRINCIDVRKLADQHLVAEYRELPRVFSLARLLAPRERVDTYRMGAGHVRFFFTRTGFLAARQIELIEECLRRRFAIQHTDAPSPVDGLDGGWHPDRTARITNLERLAERLAAKPQWYRYMGEPIDPEHYRRMLIAERAVLHDTA